MDTYTGIIKKEGKWWIGWIEEQPDIRRRAKTEDKLIDSLKKALIDFWEREETSDSVEKAPGP